MQLSPAFFGGFFISADFLFTAYTEFFTDKIKKVETVETQFFSIPQKKWRN